MKPAPFEYARPRTLDEACALLAADPEARLVSGGQTLIPMMAMRLARPSKLIDIARLEELHGIREEAELIVIGAATRQVEVERSAIVARRLPLLAAAIPWVGHAPTRTRGTVGGSIANADPAAEIPLVLATLSGSVEIRDGARRQTIPVDDLFLGPMTTSLAPTACLVAAHFPVWNQARVGVGFHEISARRSDFAYVSAAAQVALDEGGRCTRIAIGIGGATPVPTRLDAVENTLIGSDLASALVGTAVAAAIEPLEIMRDSHATETYRRRVAVGLAQRAVADAVAQATRAPA